jgi:hypothetical protein
VDEEPADPRLEHDVARHQLAQLGPVLERGVRVHRLEAVRVSATDEDVGGRIVREPREELAPSRVEFSIGVDSKWSDALERGDSY